jgi:ketosteroid isomerase-like protein
MGMAALVFAVNGRQAQASTTPVLAVDSMFTALNSGEMEAAAAAFTSDAVAENKVRGETFAGTDEISQMLAGMYREGRQFKIVDAEMDGDRITAQVEVSDRGIVWGTETILAEVKDSKLRSFTVSAFRLELWRIR